MRASLLILNRMRKMKTSRPARLSQLRDLSVSARRTISRSRQTRLSKIFALSFVRMQSKHHCSRSPRSGWRVSCRLTRVVLMLLRKRMNKIQPRSRNYARLAFPVVELGWPSESSRTCSGRICLMCYPISGRVQSVDFSVPSSVVSP